MQSISGACRKALPARDEGNGKRCKKLIRKVVKSNKKSRGGDGEDITEIQNEFPITPTIETLLYSKLLRLF